MLLSTIFAVHIATGLVVTRSRVKKAGADLIFWESLIKYADVSSIDVKMNDTIVKARKEYPAIMTWDASACEALSKFLLYGVAAVRGVFTLVPNKNKDITAVDFVKTIREQHPKVKQGIVK